MLSPFSIATLKTGNNKVIIPKFDMFAQYLGYWFVFTELSVWKDLVMSTLFCLREILSSIVPEGVAISFLLEISFSSIL